MKNILVTGGAGYIGSVLTDTLLIKGYNVTVIDNLSRGIQPLVQHCNHKAFSFAYGDVRDRSLMQKLVAKADAIIALAAIVSPKTCAIDPMLTESVNLDSIKLLNSLRGKNQPLLFPNTNIGYGAKMRQDIYDEISPMEPNSHYGITKVAAENAIREHGEYVIFRLASIFGASPAMKWHLLLNFYVYKALTEGQLIVYQQDYKRNFLHIRDLCDGFIYALEHFDAVKNEVYNIGLDAGNVTKRQLVELVKGHIPSLYIHYAEVASDPDARDYLVSNAKLQQKGFTPKISLEEGIEEMMKYHSMLPPLPQL